MNENKEWGFHGVVKTEHFTLTDKHKRKFLDVIGTDNPKSDVFLCAIEGAISSAKGAQSQRETVKPASVRRNLSNMKKSIKKLLGSFSELDELSRYLIDEIPGEPNFSEMPSTMVLYLNKISRALERADSFPKKGNLYQGHHRWLAYLVASAIYDLLGITPTLTHNEPLASGTDSPDLYAQCLAIALDAASFSQTIQDPSTIYYLMKEGMETLNSREICKDSNGDPTGLTTFRSRSL